MKKQDGGTGSQRMLWLENAITVRTRTDHKGSDALRTNRKCQPGGVNEKMRGVRSDHRKQLPSMRVHFPKEEEESLGPKWYWYVNLWTQDQQEKKEKKETSSEQ